MVGVPGGCMIDDKSGGRCMKICRCSKYVELCDRFDFLLFRVVRSDGVLPFSLREL